MPQVNITLENFESFLAEGCQPLHQEVLTSPRSIDACMKNGIVPRELLPRPFSDFLQDAGGSDAIAQMRYEHMEKRRKKKVDLAKKAREEVIEKQNNISTHRNSTPPFADPWSAASPDKSPIAVEHPAALREKSFERHQRNRSLQSANKMKWDHCAEESASDKLRELETKLQRAAVTTHQQLSQRTQLLAERNAAKAAAALAAQNAAEQQREELRQRIQEKDEKHLRVMREDPQHQSQHELVQRRAQEALERKAKLEEERRAQIEAKLAAKELTQKVAILEANACAVSRSFNNLERIIQESEEMRMIKLKQNNERRSQEEHARLVKERSMMIEAKRRQEAEAELSKKENRAQATLQRVWEEAAIRREKAALKQQDVLDNVARLQRAREYHASTALRRYEDKIRRSCTPK